MDASIGYALLRTAEPLTVDDGISPQKQASGNALPPTTFDTSDQPLRPVREYHDGFSSSICDLFASSQDRTSCCALVCCGTFLEDRNRYVLTGELPTPWWKRILVGIGVVILTIVAMAVMPGGGYWMILAFCAVGVYATRQRVPLRLRIMGDMVAARTSNNNNNNGQTPVIGMTDNCGCFRPKRAHRMCGCLENDRINTFRQVSEEEAYDPAREEVNRDACTVLWQSLALFCCGCCGCWCNCWGVCATAQEHRELRKQLPRESFLADYITMQPFVDYYAAIQDVRTRMDSSFWSHIKAISLLSRKILWLFVGLLAAISVIIFLHGNFPVARIVVVLATMGQAMAVLYVVYWHKHRFDLSLDAVIKLFGAGFVFAVGVAMITETVLSVVGGVIAYITVVFELVEDGTDSYPSDENDPNNSLHIQQMFARKHILTFLLYAAFNAFVVAGLVEELAKYFCFWMVEHPDYPDDRDDDGQATREKGLHATAAALTVGMVATATGFACAENLLYVFGEGLSLSGELKVLLLRSCTPVHPICAAIQSVGIGRRDVERDGTTGVGRALLPAVLLHGCFDFMLFAIGVLEFATSSEDDLVPAADPDAPSTLELPAAPSLVIALILTLAGLAYYFFISQQQKLRLNALMDARDSSIALT